MSGSFSSSEDEDGFVSGQRTAFNKQNNRSVEADETEAAD